MSDLFKLTFPYKTFKIKPFSSSPRVIEVKRPIIPVTVLYKDRLVQYEALIDSGADYNLFHGDIAVYLGIMLTRGSRRNIFGIGGHPIRGYQHQVKLKFGRYEYSSPITFSNQLPENSLAVFGNRGFFDHFCVHLEYQNNIITLTK